jgi:membrane protein required for colicin V production
MNKLDVIILGIAGLTTALGLWKGMVRQLVTLAGVVAGYIISSKLYVPFAHIMPKSMDPGTAKVLSFVLIFVACIIAASIMGAIASKILKVAGLSWANRLGGSLLGFLKGFVIIAVIVTVLIAFLPTDNSLMINSLTLPYVISGIRIMGDLMPHDIQNKYQNKVGELKKQWARAGLKKVEDEINNITKKQGKDK